MSPPAQRNYGATILPTESEIIKRLVEFRVADLHTAQPGLVLSFNPVKNTVDVRPLIQRIFVAADGTETVTTAPTLRDVPIAYPRGGGFRMTWELRPNDFVLLVFCERSIDAWSQTGAEVAPDQRRKHDWSDAIAYAGISPISTAIADVLPNQLVVGAEDGSVELRLDRVTGVVTLVGGIVHIAGPNGLAIGRVGDDVEIVAAENPELYQWIALVSAAASSPIPGPVTPYTGPIHGKISAGSTKVMAE